MCINLLAIAAVKSIMVSVIMFLDSLITGNTQGALQVALKDPPYGVKDKSVKVGVILSVMVTLFTFFGQNVLA